MRILKDKNNIIIKEISDFDLQQTLECGQCFRFYKQDEQDYVVVAYGRLLHIMEKDNNLVFLNKTIKEVENIWIPYFDLNRDYEKIVGNKINSNYSGTYSRSTRTQLY